MRLHITLLCALYTAVLGQDYIDGEYFIGVDPRLIRTMEQEESFLDLLKSDFKLDPQRIHRLGAKKIVFTKGSAEDARRVSFLPEVRYVEQNAMAYIAQSCPPAVMVPGCWGLDRIDQVEPLGHTTPIDPDALYEYDQFAGEGVRVYVIDTGIDTEHPNFEGRAVWGYLAIGPNPPDEPDDHGHGTAVAGIVGAATYGVAKQATLVAVKSSTSSGSGAWESIIDGIDWILNRDEDRGYKSVVTLSMGGSGQQTYVEDAMEALAAENICCVAAAGNVNQDACSNAPAFVNITITVGATDIEDAAYSLTNWGPCVDIYAPGVMIMTTEHRGGTTIVTGSSFSCPFVAGAVARYLSFMKTGVHPDNVIAWLRETSVKDAITFLPSQDPAGSNMLLRLPCPMAD